MSNEKVEKAEEKNQKCFNKVMDSLFNLANEFHERDDLTKNEAVFLVAFDKYMDSWNELDEAETAFNEEEKMIN